MASVPFIHKLVSETIALFGWWKLELQTANAVGDETIGMRQCSDQEVSAEEVLVWLVVGQR